jgi:hypothetical protein
MTQTMTQTINLQGGAQARMALPGRAARLEAAHAGRPAAIRAALTDCRGLHRGLFAPEAGALAGLWRGTPGSPAAEMRRAVRIARRAPGLRACDPCAPPEEVGPGMAALGARIGALLDAPPRGDAAYDAMAEVTEAFFRLHPFADGNGHVLRLMLRLMAPALGLAARPDWTVHPRPYDATMSLCLQWYAAHPALLSCALRRWFDPA